MARLLWEPSAAFAQHTRLRAYMDWLAAERGVVAASYEELWRWSVADLDAFWSSIAVYFGVRFAEPPQAVLGRREMPGAQWFAGATLSHPEHVLRDRDDDAVAIRHASELRPLRELTWGELRAQVAQIQDGLRRLGVRRGDRVAAYLPNVPEAIAAFLAVAGLGAIWSSCSPEFGVRAVVDRFAQIEPVVLLAVDGYRYGGRDHDRSAAVAQIHAQVGGRLVRLGYLDGSGWQDGFLGDARAVSFEIVPFEHPLWILYSSGTTGLPKAIVHSHGGMLLEHLKKLNLHLDAHADDRVFWFTTTGWMMWNFLVDVLLTPASIVLYDGSPAHPSPDRLWDLASEAGVTCFGTSAAYIGGCMKAGVVPRGGGRELGALRSVGSTGSPLSAEAFRWIYEQLGEDTWLFSTSGGTDVCTAFVGGCPLEPVYEGELQARSLGCDVRAFDERGRSVVGEVGELVIAQPMPSMPVGFWNDPDGERLREAYFDTYPGVWRHGDWIEITQRGSAVIHGRSDATINRGGVRIGTSEIYGAVLALDEILDALAVDVDGWLALFVVLCDGAALDDGLRAQIARRVREDCSPRHVPDDVLEIAEVPRTLSGKLLEVPVKRILAGAPADQVASRDSLANPAALDWFVELRRSRTQPPR